MAFSLYRRGTLFHNCSAMFVVILFASLCDNSQAAAVRNATEHKKLLIVSFDGFRWDYYNKYPTPNFDNLAKNGVHAKVGIRPAFTTKTFPNHYTLATGLYEESHGILDNEMYDPVFNETFTQRNTDPKWWEAGEPLWITATRQGLTAGVYFWAGGNIVFKNNLKPKYTVPFNMSIPFETRVNTIVNWLANQGADLVMAYFHEPDESAHNFGVFSQNVAKAVEHVDKTLGYLMQKLEENDLKNNTNIMILSDHGMVNRTTGDYIIDLSAIPELNDKVAMIVPTSGPVVGILPKTNTAQEIDSIVKILKRVNKPMTVYKKEDIPERYHYKHNRRIMPIIMVANEGYVVARMKSDVWEMIGYHGYDNNLSAMRPIFFATGPDFKKNYQFGIVENVNVYPLACHLLGIRPASNNGTLSAMANTLVNNAAKPVFNEAKLIVFFAQALAFMLFPGLK